MMRKAKVISFLMAMIMVLGMGCVFAEENRLLIAPNPMVNDDSIKVLLNDQMIDFTDDNGNKVEPQIINSRTMVPMRRIFEVFGAEVEWNGELREVTAKTAEKTLKLTIDNPIASVATGEETESITLDAAPTIIDGRTLVPVRFIAESLDLKVGWDQEQRTVIILDTSFVLEKIEKDAPVLYEILTMELDDNTVESAEASLSATGDVKYTNSNDKSSNTNLKLTINGKVKENPEAAAIDLDIKTTGKGTLLDSIKEAKLEKATLNFIADKENMIAYIKSNLLESSEIGKNWAAISFADAVGKIDLNTTSELNIQEVIDEVFNNIPLTTDTYYQLEEVLNFICKLFGEDYLKVTGRTTKTYTYEITLDELLGIFGVEKEQLMANNVQINDVDLTLKVTVKVEDNITSSANIIITGKVKSGNENIEFTLKTDSKLTSKGKTVSITLPKEKDVVSMGL